jgi:hypothetical protein
LDAWVGHRAKEHDCLSGIVIETATVTAGLIYVLRDWRNQPHFYTLKGVESEGTQTMKVAPIERADWNLRRRGTGGLSLAKH